MPPRGEASPEKKARSRRPNGTEKHQKKGHEADLEVDSPSSPRVKQLAPSAGLHTVMALELREFMHFSGPLQGTHRAPRTSPQGGMPHASAPVSPRSPTAAVD